MLDGSAAEALNSVTDKAYQTVGTPESLPALKLGITVPKEELTT
ncbi:hypothetical protein [Deinococcus sp. QL22]|nr:hypothetical protein [Deinococcus sp. QL22]